MSYLRCGTEQRRIAVENSETLNGIDYLEVFINKSNDNKYHSLILLGCFKDLPELGAKNVAIKGGIRIRNVQAKWAMRADMVMASLADKTDPIISDLGGKELQIIKGISSANLRRTLVIRPDGIGDFTIYSLHLQDTDDPMSPPANFDLPLSKVDFSFKVDCSSEYDYTIKHSCPPTIFDSPLIDYMAKDFASFRRLMLDRFSTIIPDWKERSPADLGIVLVELLAYVGDNLSYYQDAVATEAYLGTARKRISARRHARLLDYFVHDGCNARTWVCFEISGDLAKSYLLPRGTALLTSGTDDNVVVEKEKFDEDVQKGSEVFETMHPVLLYSSHNEIYFYTWGDYNCYLPKGSTSATLIDNSLNLKVNDVLIFEEVLSPSSWNASDRDLSHVHAVRLTGLKKTLDHLKNISLVEISWGDKDALPFALCLYEKDLPRGSTNQDNKLRVSVARGNTVLADNGHTLLTKSIQNGNEKISVTESLGSTPEQGQFRPRLSYGPLTFACPYDENKPALFALNYGPSESMPCITLKGETDLLGSYQDWSPAPDLISLDEFDRKFVVEIESDGTAYLRFGTGESEGGKMPLNSTAGTKNLFYAIYRKGNGTKGNVGSETITRIRKDNDIQFDTSIIKKIRNPLAARGGVEPESIDEIKQYAPYAFLKQRRAVTAKDYEETLMQHPEVQRAHATLRWTGSWYTVFIAIDRKGGLGIDKRFKSDILEFIRPYVLAGRDIKILEPSYVALYIKMQVRVKQNHYRSIVKQKLYSIFSNGITERGSKGFFHPDNFTFGQSVYLSQIYSTAMKVEGIEQVTVQSFQRWSKPDKEGLDQGYVSIADSEIARLDNDPNFQENGEIQFVFVGGL